MPGDATICQSGKTRKAFFQMTCVISRATPKITAEAGSTCASDAPWRGDGHSGQQRPCVPSGICRRPCSNTKQPPLLFPSRLRARPTLRKPPSRSGSPQAAGRRGQISGWKARATFIRAHSCPFVVQRHPCVSLRVFASSREAHGLEDPLPAAAVRRQPVAEGRSRAGKPELRLIESGDRGH